MKKYLLIYSIYFSFVSPNDSVSKIDSLKKELTRADTYFEKCDIYLNIGALHHDLSNFNQALESYKKVLLYENRLSSAPEQLALLYSTYNSIAQVYEEWGDYKNASIYYNKCNDYCNKENNLLIGPCPSIILASSLTRASPLNDKNLSIHYSKVISNLDNLIQSANKNQDYEYLVDALLTKSHVSLENSHIDTTVDYDYLIKQIEQAIKICSDIIYTNDSTSHKFQNSSLIKNLAYGYTLLGFVYDNKNDFINSVKYYKKAIKVRKIYKDNDLTGLRQDYKSLAEAFYNLDDYDNAILYANKSLGLIEPLLKTATTDKLKILYYSKLIDSYYLIIDAYFKLGDYENGFQAIQNAKAKSLSSKISIKNDKIPSLSIIRRSIAKDEAYIVYSNIRHEKFICMTITYDNIKYKIIEPLNFIDMKLQSLIKLYLKQVSKPNFDNALYIDSSKKLYSILIEPIENNIENKKDIKFFLDGSLSFLPVETLIDSNGSFFIEKYNNISYFPSVSIKNTLDQRIYDNRKIELIAFGDPLYENNKIIDTDIVTDNISVTNTKIRSSINKSDELSGYYIQQGYNFPSLPYSKEEIKNIISLFPNSTYYNNKSFTEDKLKELSRDSLLINFNIIHFATHGIIYPELPELDALILSQYNDLSLKEDGFLTKYEISQLNIKCDLTILSCCETAIGNIYDGEGVVNLSNSFFIAGSNAVIATLWPIFDESTSIFMYNYYKYFKMKKDYSKSLVRIKKDFIKGTYGEKYKHPSFWGAFVYYGK